MLKLYTIMKKDGIIMTTQAKGTLLQKSRRMLGRGYELFTIQEIKLAQKLQKKFSFGYALGRVLGFMTKLLIAVILFFVLGWVLLFALAALGFFATNSKSSFKSAEDTDEGFCSNQYDYETPGTSEHISANPDLYDSYGNFK